jgi:hypothetical protein
VVERGGSPGFFDETFLRVLVNHCIRQQKLDGDFAMEGYVFGQVNFAHSS